MGIPVGIHQPTKTVYSIYLWEMCTQHPKKGFQGVEGPHTHARVVRRPSVRVDRPSKTETVVCLFDSIKLARSYQHTHASIPGHQYKRRQSESILNTFFFFASRSSRELVMMTTRMAYYGIDALFPAVGHQYRELVEYVCAYCWVRDTTPPHAHMNPPNLSRQRSRPPTQAQQQRHGWKFGR